MLKQNLLGAIFVALLSTTIPAVAQDANKNMQGDNMMDTKMKSTQMKDEKMSKTTKSKHRKNRKHKTTDRMDKNKM